MVQQVYLRLWESRSSVCITASLKNYLYTMAKNHVLNMIRDKNEWIVRQYENIQQENDIADDGLQEKLEEERKLSCFYRAVKQLPGAKREICLLKIYEGLNNQEIAHRLNIPVGTVKNYYTQSIQLLKYYLKELY
ncbi:MAG: RNA polymerase sigma factor [Bacteroides cellulosilyticus]